MKQWPLSFEQRSLCSHLPPLVGEVCGGSDGAWERRRDESEDGNEANEDEEIGERH